MCDFSLQAIKSRDAALEDQLVAHSWGTGTVGLCSVDDVNCAVCVKPGTEIAFAEPYEFLNGKKFDTAIFRQKYKDQPHAHHDYLEFPDGSDMMLTSVPIGTRARIIQLPAAPKNAVEEAEQTRAAFV